MTLALLVEEGNSCVYFEGTYQTEMLPEMSRTKPAQGQKNTSFELQSAPNLHRDKKNKSFELQSAPNLHRDKKNKKNKKFRGILAPSQVDWKVFVFFVFFCPCAGLVHSFFFQNFCFFVPVQVWCTLKFKTCVFFVPVQAWCTLKFKIQCNYSFLL